MLSRSGWGLLAALVSAAMGGMAVAVTRTLAGAVEPTTIGAFRFGIGTLVLLPLVLGRHDPDSCRIRPGGRSFWPRPPDWPGVAGIGLTLFALFPLLFNTALIFTSAARGALVLSTIPLLTLTAGAAFGVERMTGRKIAGVLVAMAGVASAMVSGLGSAPGGAWRGDLLMLAGALCMALTNVWSQTYLGRASVAGFTVMAMATGAVVLVALAILRGGFAMVPGFGVGQWAAVAYLGVIGGAAGFYLWSWALERTSPSIVAVSIAANPVAAILGGAVLLGEGLHASQAWGVVAVTIGVWLTASPRKKTALAPPPAPGYRSR